MMEERQLEYLKQNFLGMLEHSAKLKAILLKINYLKSKILVSLLSKQIENFF